jgi:hypothetical protein
MSHEPRESNTSLRTSWTELWGPEQEFADQLPRATPLGVLTVPAESLGASLCEGVPDWPD